MRLALSNLTSTELLEECYVYYECKLSNLPVHGKQQLKVELVSVKFMPVRYPPDNQYPRTTNRDLRNPRVVSYVESRPSFVRRVLRRLFSAPVLIPLVFVSAIVLGILIYYWTVFSGRIDNLLAGEVFTRTAGIYAAPKQLRVNETISQADVITFLKRAGYVEKTQQADESRGRYSVNGTALEIEPSSASSVDGAKQFQSVRVQFGGSGKSISSMTDLEDRGSLQRVWLEPELISSVTGTERAKRKVIGFSDLPPHLVKAITVTEDRSFFEHYGVNIRGIIRAFIRRYDSDPNSPIARQGGSSITQQLVKNLLLSPEQTWRRKISEAYMSIILETRLSKEKIFELYCNQVYMGQQAGFSINGFGEASSAYFNKDVTNLTLPESAFLAGLIRSPNRYNPYTKIETATARRNQVLDSMAEAGAITQEEATTAKATPLQVVPARGRIDVSDAPYFADYVQNQLGDMIAGNGGTEHLRIYTTIDMDLQRAAYAALTKQMNALDKIQSKRFAPGTLQAALVAMNAKTGEIVAMVGGRDYSKSQLNRATDAYRQPGSVFKPFVYATALNTAFDPVPRVITPATTYMDEPKTFTFDNQEYSPGNFGETYTHEPVTLRDGLVHSLNVVTVEVAMEVTIGRVMNLAAKAGLPKPPRAYPAMALGTSEATPLQIASAYTAFANLGSRTTPIAINRITTGDGVTIAAPTTQRSEVLRPEVAYVMTSFMKDVVNRGTAAKVRGARFETGAGREDWNISRRLVCGLHAESCLRGVGWFRRWFATRFDWREFRAADLVRLHAGRARRASGVGRRLGHAGGCRAGRDQSEDRRADCARAIRRSESSFSSTALVQTTSPMPRRKKRRQLSCRRRRRSSSHTPRRRYRSPSPSPSPRKAPALPDSGLKERSLGYRSADRIDRG